MLVVVGIAVGLILAGLIMAYLSGTMPKSLLTTVTYWVGVVLVIVGLILLLTPVFVWLSGHLRAMLGAS